MEISYLLIVKLFKLFLIINYAFAKQCVDELCSLDQSLYFSSPSFPNPYKNEDTSISLSVQVKANSNRAFAFQFYRFALGPNDCLYFCSTNALATCLSKIDPTNSTMVKKCGNEMDHRRPSHYYDLTDTLYIFFVPQNTSIPYPGFEGRVMSIDKNSQIYNDCNQENTVNLDKLPGFWTLSSDHFFMNTPTVGYGKLNISCQIKLSTSINTNIRAAIYAFDADSTQPMNFTGTLANGSTETTISLWGNKDPLAYYFQKELILSYKFSSDKKYFYYLIVSSYNDTSKFGGCKNVGTFDMSQQRTVSFSALQDSAYGYEDNTDCGWTFNNPPKNSQIMLQMTTYTERCCDVVKVNGTNSDPLKFDGYYPWTLVYGTPNDMIVRFQSDPFEAYTQMIGTVTVVDCSCSQSLVTLKSGDTVNITFGYDGTFPYCSVAQCNWTVNFDRTSILQITSKVRLLSGDILNVQNSRGSVLSLSTGTIFFDTSDNIQISFNSSKKIYTNNRDDGNAGIAIFLTSIELEIETIQKDLCADEFVDIHGDMLTQNFQAVVYQVSTKSCAKPIIANFFDNPQGYLVDVYDGELTTGAPLKWNNFTDTKPLSIESNLITIRIVRLDGATSFHALLTTNQDVFVSSNPSPCVDSHTVPIGIDLIITGNRSRTIIIYQASGAVGGLYGMTLKFTGRLLYELFQGPSTKDQDRIFGEASKCDAKMTATNPSNFVFGQYVTLRLQAPQNGTVEYFCGKQSSMWSTAFDSQPGIIMSPKYLTPAGPSMKTYSYTVEYTGTGHKTIILDFLNKIPVNGNLTVIASSNDATTIRSYSSDSPACHDSFNATRIVMNYQWNCASMDGCGPGLLLQYRTGDGYQPSGNSKIKMLNSFSLSIALIFVMLFKSF